MQTIQPNTRWERFLQDVEKLQLRFPVAHIANKTGYDKGNVSKYLKGVLQPSEAFMQAVYEAYKGEFSDMYKTATYTTRGANETKKPDEGELIRQYREMVETKQRQIESQQKQIDQLNEAVKQLTLLITKQL